MPRKLPDARPKSIIERLTTRHYGGTRGQSARTPTSQDTGKAFGRGGRTPARHKAAPRWGANR